MIPIERVITNVFKENIESNTEELVEIVDGLDWYSSGIEKVSRGLEIWFVNYFVAKSLYEVIESDQTIDDLIVHLRRSLLDEVSWPAVVELITKLVYCPDSFTQLLTR
jgi:hypothetical protein